MNPMRALRLNKVTLNIGVGQAGDKLEKAVQVLAKITNEKPVKTKTMQRIPTWGIRPKLPIGCKVTVRGKKAHELLQRLFKAVDNQITIQRFDKEGNFAFGIKEYIDIPGAAYDVDIGILGLEAAVTLERPGFRIKRRTVKQAKVPYRHRITKEEAINFVKNVYRVEVVEDETI